MPTNSNRQNRLLLIDGSSYLYRAFYAMPNLRLNAQDPQSQPTGAIRGMINMLQALRKEVAAEYAVCVFDAKGPSFREQIYPEYKANRPSMPDDLRLQIEPIHQVVQLLGFPVLAVTGVEADDIIGTIAKHADQLGLAVTISSGDKDLCQLVTSGVKLIDTMSGKLRDQAGVEQEFGVAPALMLDYQTLVGDTVDNVPGVAKVGPKTAVKWLQQFGNLDNIVANADKIGGVVGANLRASLAWLPTAKELLTIKTDCDLTKEISGFPALDAIKLQPLDLEPLRQFYLDYGFQSLLYKLPQAETKASSISPADGQLNLFASAEALPASSTAALTPAAAVELDYQCILTWADFEHWLAKLEQAELTAIDTETSSLLPMQAKLIGISFSVQSGEAAYLPLGHDYIGAPTQLDLEQVLARLKPWLENPARFKVGQNSKYEQHIFANNGINLSGYQHDTMLQSYVLEVQMPHNLTSLALRHLKRSAISYEDVCGKGAQQIPFSQVAIEVATKYAAEDAEQCLAVHQQLWPQLQQQPKLLYIYQLEMASSAALFQIERNGVLIDIFELQQQSQSLQQKIDACTTQAFDLAGEQFNLNSPKQIAEIFYQKLGYPILKKTAKGAPSTNEEVLEKLALDYPLPAAILQHRSYFKLKSTYTDKLPLLVDRKTGRIHTNYAQAVAVTGRLSSLEPNLQNIPVRTVEGREIRKAFIAPQGKLIASADYSQIELRIMAHLSEDKNLLQAFTDGKDVHKSTAAEIFSIPIDQVNAEQRRLAKVINFGLIYGMGSHGLSRNLGISHGQAKNYIETYFSRYPGVRDYMERTKLQAKQQGYVETVFGRRLALPEINSAQAVKRAAAERAAINAPMQGTAADLIKLSMVAVQQAITAEQPDLLLIMQVHDELVFELYAEQLDWIKQRIPQLMAGVTKLKVPLLAEIGVGDSWEEAH